MARRVATNALTFDMVVETVREMLEESGNDVVKVTDLAKRLDTYPSDVMVAWNNADPDGKIIDGDRGEMWLTEENGENPPPAPVAESPKPTTPAQRLKARKATSTPVPAPAVTPVLDNQGEPIIAPETGGRQLDASQGERVLSEGDVRQLVKGTNTPNESEKTMTEVSGSWINDGGESHMTPQTDGEPVHPGHTLLNPVEFMAPPPEGVNPNFWELYLSANTLRARAFWAGKVKEQQDAHKEAVKAAEEAAPAPVVYEIPIDPMTGQPFPF